MFMPKARYRFYGSPVNYASAFGHAIKIRKYDYRRAVETEVASMLGIKHALCVPQARFGLYLVFARLITPERPNVVMSPYTIHDVVNMVLCAGGQPVFADIEAETCNIDAAQVRDLVDDHTAAVMVTHLHGLACDIGQIRSICDESGVPLVEDAAQAFGARVGGQFLGSFGDASVFSFGRAKNVNAFYGGMVVTRNATLAESIRREVDSLPNESTKKLIKRMANCLLGDILTAPPVYSWLTFKVFRYGAIKGVDAVNKVVQTENNPVRKEKLPATYRRQLTQMQARLIQRQLPKLDRDTQARLQMARIYHEGLSGQEGVILPPWREDGSHIYLQFPIQVEDRWDYVRYMMRHGRDLAIQHMRSAAELDIFQDFFKECPNARSTADRLVLLPTYPGYGELEVRENVRVTLQYLQHSRMPG